MTIQRETATAATQREFAAHVGISQAAVSNLVSDGVLRRGSTLDEWRLAYLDHLMETAIVNRINDLFSPADARRYARLVVNAMKPEKKGVPAERQPAGLKSSARTRG